MSEVIDLSDGLSGDEEVQTAEAEDPECQLEQVDRQLEEVRTP